MSKAVSFYLFLSNKTYVGKLLWFFRKREGYSIMHSFRDAPFFNGAFPSSYEGKISDNHKSNLLDFTIKLSINDVALLLGR